MSTINTDQNLQTIRINDFSPGIYSFARYGYPQIYTPEAPLGSAATAFRCYNLPGIGLAPFPTYKTQINVPTASAPDAATTIYCTGFFAFGPVITDTSYPQRFNAPDELFVSFDYIGGGVRFRQVSRVASDGGTVLNLLSTSASVSLNYRYCPDFVITRIFQNGFPNAAPIPVVVWCELDLNRIYFSPDVTSAAGTLPASGFTALVQAPIHTIAHAARVGLLNTVNIPITSAVVQNVATDEDMFTTDPPESYTVGTGFNQYNPESFNGFGAWGSISSGELLIIKRGGGGLLINGDIRAPSGVVKLPGVVGTGRVMQKGALTAAGMLYVTENDGVYSWNGGNTAQKISRQIPDDACRRKELGDSTTVGTLSMHDAQNNLCFFANNWVYDCVNNSWWRSEDPAVVTFSAFSRGSSGRYIWAVNGSNPNTSSFLSCYQFDMQNGASTWTWTSNPIPVSMGSLMELEYVEIVASCPVGIGTFVITPTTPATTSIGGNNPQTLTLTIPSGRSAARVGGRLGYRDYNVQIKIDASNSSALNNAPILHEIILGYRTNAGPVGVTG